MNPPTLAGRPPSPSIIGAGPPGAPPENSPAGSGWVVG